MKKIDFDQAEIDCQKCDYAFAASGTDEDGYNTAVELANKETILAIENLTADRDYWKTRWEIASCVDTSDITLIQGLIQRIEKLESKLIIDEQAMDTLYCDIKDLRRKIKKSKSNSWTQTVDNAIDDLMPALSETICELKIRIEKLEEDFRLKHLSEYSYDLKKINDRIGILENDKQTMIDQIHDLEQNAVMDGDEVRDDTGILFKFTKIK